MINETLPISRGSPLILFLVLGVLSARADQVLERLPEDEPRLRNSLLDILVVSVVTAEAGPAQGGELIVEEVLRGHTRPGKLAFTFPPLQPGEDQSRRASFVGALRSAGRLIIFAYVGEAAQKIILQGPVYHYSEQNRLTVLSRMAAPGRSVWLQLPLLVFMLGLPFISLALYLFSAALVPERKRKFRRIARLLPMIALGLYLYYESGIPGTIDIRPDLLLIYPVLAFNSVLLLFYAIVYFTRKDH